MASLRAVSGRRLASTALSTSSRSYATQATATAADFKVSSSSSGIKIATLDEGAPTSAVTVAIRAGPRFESQPGLAHVLKNFVFKSTNKRSALRVVRETELLGGVLSASLTREHLFLTAECMRGDEPYFTEILGDVLTQSKFAAHEYHEEVVPAVAVEYEQAQQSPEIIALDLAHQLAFRRGLGNSLFATPHLEVPLNSAVAYARSSFAATDRIAVLASGVDSGLLNNLVGEFFTNSSATSSASSQAAVTGSSATKYYGGELRIPSTAHGGHDVGSLLVGFQGGAQNQPEYAVLKALLGGESSLKWANGTTPLSQLTPLVGGSDKPVIKAFNLPYSDAGLFGLFVSAPTEKVGELATKAIAAIKEVASGSLKDEQVKAAIARAKFAAASALESRLPRQEIIGAQILETSSVTSLADAFAALDKVSASKIQEAAKAILKSKPSVVAVGDTHKLPYADELGL